MKHIAAMLLFILLLTGSLVAQDMNRKMDELVTAYAEQHKFNGTLLVAHKGKVLYQKSYGYRNAAAGTRNDENSIYQIGSITKQITAAVIMQLVEEKKLSLDDRLSKFFPSIANAERITIEHLLTHTSGIFNYTNDTVLMKSDVTKHYGSSDMIKLFSSYQADFEPGTKWNYSNSAYSLLGYIIEKVEKKPYEKVVRQRIFQPLGMTQSGFDFTHLKSPYKTQGYFSLNPETKAAPVVDSTIAYAAGAVYSTVGDLYKWERGITEGKILQPASWKAVFTPFKNKYGYGWGIDSLYGRPTTAHTGGIHGYTSYLLRFPSEELTVIALDNASSRALVPLSRSLAAIVLGADYKIPAAPTQVVIAEDILKTYTGEYQLAPNFSITIFLDGGVLKGQATGQEAFELFPEKENRFFLKVVEAKIEFIKNDKGEVTELVLYQNGMAPRGKKIK